MKISHCIFLVLLFISVMGCDRQSEKFPAGQSVSGTTLFEDPPAWAKTAIWYQIMVERFRNGDPANDPTVEDIKGAGSSPEPIPANWHVTPWIQDWYREDAYCSALPPDLSFDYKVQLRRYGGDLQGVLDKLDYLDSLGVTAIYFNPLNDAPSLHKYDARNWRHIDRNFGPDPRGDQALIEKETPTDPDTWKFTAADQLFLELLEQLHRRGIKVILDYSWNHTGTEFWAWKDLLKEQQNSEYADWYWVSQFDDPGTPENEFAYRGWAGVAGLPEIKESEYVDHSNGIHPYEGDIVSDAVKQHVFRVTRRWLDPNGDGDPGDGVDGFRLDVAAELPLGFWREYREVVRAINPEALLIGEVWWEKWPDDLLDPAPYMEGDIFDAVMNYRWYKLARHFFNASPDAITVTEFIDGLDHLNSGIRTENQYAMMNLTASHDAPRVATSLFNKNKYKYYSSPFADSTYKIHQPDAATFETLKLLLVQQFTYPGAPHIWAGDEMGMWGADDPSCRKPLIWPDYTFEPERVHPMGLEKPVDEVQFDHDLFAFYQRLIHIRRDNPVLAAGAIDFILQDDERQLLAYSRFDQELEVITVFNTGLEPTNITLALKKDRQYREILGNGQLESHSERTLQIELDGRTAAILRSE
ncbi:MAG: glycoside hydrolase family 13 protein [Saprospiraceae bacterium]|nr:glycoside hydrolase family 13 protein [Lewinella sp.]